MTQKEQIFSVEDYVALLNKNLRQFRAKITGEVTEVKIVKGNVYFTLKDREKDCVLNCLIWQNNYQLCGVKLEQGLEVVLSGYPDIYPPYGRLSFKADAIELKGKGPLKKAYEKLKKKLKEEGLFAEERKRALPRFPRHIGVITSEKGAVIGDFLNNLNQYGFRIKMIDSRVEGQDAVKDIYEALQQFKKEKIDALVVMRGGGSLESLQAFNNEALVREVVDFPVPVIAAIGHDKDVPLMALTADVGLSTPTAAAMVLNRDWDKLAHNLPHWQNRLLESFQQWVERLREEMSRSCQQITDIFEIGLKEKRETIKSTVRYLKAVDPRRNLKLGYSIVFTQKEVIKDASQLEKGQLITTRFYKGQAESKVEKTSTDPH